MENKKLNTSKIEEAHVVIDTPEEEAPNPPEEARAIIDTPEEKTTVNGSEKAKEPLDSFSKVIESLEQEKEILWSEFNSATSAKEKADALLAIADTEKSIIESTQRKNNSTQEGPAQKKAFDNVKSLDLNINQGTKETVDQFITQYSLTDVLPEGFEKLSEEQKLFVVQNTKRRILDIVNDDAKTQYSKDLKDRMTSAVSAKGTFDKIKQGAKSALKGAGEAIEKDFKVKKEKNKAFEKLRDTPEGKALIQEEMELLTEGIKDTRVYRDEDGTVKHQYFSTMDFKNSSKEEDATVLRFNTAANTFREMPYEWGQEAKGWKATDWVAGKSGTIQEITGVTGHKRKYEKAKKEYEEAKAEMLRLKEARETEEEKGTSAVEMRKLDAFINMQQLLGTHPELEKELNALGKNPGTDEIGKTVNRALNHKSLKYIALTGVGIFAKKTAKESVKANVIAFAGSAIIGATVGGLKGYMKAKDALKTEASEARHGKEKESSRTVSERIFDEKKKLEEAKKRANDPQNNLSKIAKIENEREIKQLEKSLKKLEQEKDKVRNTKIGNFTDITHLSKELDNARQRVEELTFAHNHKERDNALALLNARIEHTKAKIEKGEVNFGNERSKQTNFFNLTNSLNEAMVLKESNVEEVDAETQKRIKRLVTTAEKITGEKKSAVREAFITKQWQRGAIKGAAAVTVGYVGRWVYEYAQHLNIHWPWGHDAENVVQTPIDTGETITDTIPVNQPAPNLVPEDTTITEPGDALNNPEATDMGTPSAPPIIEPGEVDPPLVPPAPETPLDSIKENPPEVKIYRPPTDIYREAPEMKKDGVDTWNGPKEEAALRTPRFMPPQDGKVDTMHGPSRKIPGLEQDTDSNGVEQGEPNPTDQETDQKIEQKEPENKVVEKIEKPYEEPEADGDKPIQERTSNNEYTEPETGNEKPYEEPGEDIQKPTEKTDTSMHPSREDDYANSEVVEETKNIKTESVGKIPVENNPTSSIDDHVSQTHEYTSTEREAIKTTEAMTGEQYHNEDTKINTVKVTASEHEDVLKKEIAPDTISDPTLDKEVVSKANEFYKNINNDLSNKIEHWQDIKKSPVEPIWNMGPETDTYVNLENSENTLYNYMKKLYNITKLEPQTETLLRGAETNENYIKRALLWIAKKQAESGKDIFAQIK